MFSLVTAPINRDYYTTYVKRPEIDVCEKASLHFPALFSHTSYNGHDLLVWLPS